MKDSFNLSMIDPLVNQSDVAIQTATNNVPFGLSFIIPEKANLTNVFAGTTSESNPIIASRRVSRKGNFLRLFTGVLKHFIPHKNRELILAPPKVNNVPAVIPNTSKDICLLPNKESVEQAPKRLANPMADDYAMAYRKSLLFWNKFHNDIPPEYNEQYHQIVKVLAEAWHIPATDPTALMAFDFDTMVTVIRNLRKKVGVSELVVMLLLALIVKDKLYKQIRCGSEAAFFSNASEIMGISSSLARDYSKRGYAFLKYHHDLLDGIGETTGIPLEEFITSHMSKLTIYEKAVERFGREGALVNLKSRTFRDFQSQLSFKKESGVSDKIIVNPCIDPNKPAKNSRLIHLEQKKEILELNLMPNEKRLLRIIAKGGKYLRTKYLTEEQVILVETRLREKRLHVIENNLKNVSGEFVRKGYNDDNPLAFSDDLYELKNVNDIILRIRAGIAQTIPARRTIAILVERLFRERKHEWQHPYGGPEYTNFRDFAMEKLGMGEDYRDYIAVGKVLNDYYYFLSGISDIDTEDVFLKLRYIPKALLTHKEDEPLVLARLCSLTIREFKVFSEEPDFETTFSKKLSKKQLENFHDILYHTRSQEKWYLSDFIEIFNENEKSWVENIVDKVLSEAEVLLDPPKTRVSFHETA